MSVVSFHAPLVQTIAVFPAAAIPAAFGVNEGEEIRSGADLLLDDVYKLAADAKPAVLALQRTDEGHFAVARTSHAGTAGNLVHFDCLLTLMTPTATVTEVVVLIEADAGSDTSRTYLLPLSPLEACTPHSLIGIDHDTAARRFAQSACASFTRGTHIAMGNGQQKPVEDLKVGDAVLTRDAGVQILRWIGRTTQRALGDLAPVRIAAGALNNDRDLRVSPDHRLFIYQRSDHLGAGRAEVLIKAGHLVNGTDVTQDSGGFVDYFQLLFDRHQIVFAEGIAAESLLIDERTINMLPDSIASAFRPDPAATSLPALSDLEVPEALLQRPNTTDILRRATTP